MVLKLSNGTTPLLDVKYFTPAWAICWQWWRKSQCRLLTFKGKKRNSGNNSVYFNTCNKHYMPESLWTPLHWDPSIFFPLTQFRVTGWEMEPIPPVTGWKAWCVYTVRILYILGLSVYKIIWKRKRASGIFLQLSRTYFLINPMWLRGPGPIWTSNLLLQTSPCPLLIFQATLMYLFSCLWVVRLVLKQNPFPPHWQISAWSTCLSDFRKQLKLPACCAVYVWGMRGRKGSRVGTWVEEIIQQKNSPG